MTAVTTGPDLQRLRAAVLEACRPAKARKAAGRFGLGPTVSAVFVLTVLVVSLLANVIEPAGPLVQHFNDRLQGPSWSHLLGTDGDGRDVMTRLVFGARTAFEGLLVLVVVAGGLGTAWGLAAGFIGGWVDAILMRIADTCMAFPGVVLAIAVAGVLGPNLTHAMAAVGLVLSPTIARLLRSSIQTLRRSEFILVARSLGVSRSRCALVHVLPNAWAPAFVQLWLSLTVGLLAEAGLSFLGLGVKPPTPSWGGMLADSYQYFTAIPLQTVAPGLTITITCLALSQIGEGLRRTLIDR